MSKFGWSLPAGCGTLPTELGDEPLVPDLCPHCKAIAVDWKANKIDESFGGDSGLYEKFRCPYCQQDIESLDKDGFTSISSDEFADMIVDWLPEPWEVLATHDKWQDGVVVGIEENSQVIHEDTVYVELDEKGHFRLKALPQIQGE